VPVTVSEYVPAAAVPLLMVRVELPPAVTEVGLNDPLAPDGRPETLRLTDWALPLVTAVAMVEVPAAPCAMLTLDGLAEMEKSLPATALMVSVTEVVCVVEPAPVTVRE
jgi:hypothetical protein